MNVMGLTDPLGKVIYLADGLELPDAMDTLVHEFSHMRGFGPHDDAFYKDYNKLAELVKSKRLIWDNLS